MGRPFTVKTDQQSLKYLLEQKIGTSAQQKWFAKLLGYNFVVEYKKGKENLVAGALSRKVEIEDFSHDGDDIQGVLCMVSFPTPTLLTDLTASYGSDQKVQGTFQAFQLGKEVPKGFSI